MLTEEELSGQVIGAANEVHRILGPGLLESIYQKSLEIELTIRGIDSAVQSCVPLRTKGQSLGEDLIMDFFFPSRLVVELKSVAQLNPVHSAQLLTHMKLSQTPVGLLINFNVPILKEGIKRLVL